MTREKDPLISLPLIFQGGTGTCQGVLVDSPTAFSEAKLVQLLKNYDNPITSSHLFIPLLKVIINKSVHILFSSATVGSN